MVTIQGFLFPSQLQIAFSQVSISIAELRTDLQSGPIMIRGLCQLSLLLQERTEILVCQGIAGSYSKGVFPERAAVTPNLRQLPSQKNTSHQQERWQRKPKGFSIRQKVAEPPYCRHKQSSMWNIAVPVRQACA